MKEIKTLEQKIGEMWVARFMGRCDDFEINPEEGIKKLLESDGLVEDILNFQFDSIDETPFWDDVESSESY